MRRARGALVGVFALGLLGLAVACGDLSSSTDGGPSATNRDAGVTDASGPTGKPGAPGPLVAIHASYNLPAFRLCLPGRLGAPPAPAAGTMARSNLVGVDVGSAARLDGVTAVGDAGAPRDAGAGDAAVVGDASAGDGGKVQDAATSDAAKADAAAPPVPIGKVHVIPESLVRYRTDSCEAILPTLAAGSFYSLDLLAFAGATLDSSVTRLVVVDGCAPGMDPGNALLACGDGYDPVLGNLRARLVEISVPAVPTVAGVEVRPLVASPSFVKLEASLGVGDVDTGTAELTVGLPQPRDGLGAASVIRLPQSLDGYQGSGFIASSKSAPTMAQSFADVVELSSPQALPSAYWAQVASVAVVVVGRMNVAETDPRTKLHFLAIPTSYRLLPTSPAVDGGDGGGGSTTVGGDF